MRIFRKKLFPSSKLLGSQFSKKKNYYRPISNLPYSLSLWLPETLSYSTISYRSVLGERHVLPINLSLNLFQPMSLERYFNISWKGTQARLGSIFYYFGQSYANFYGVWFGRAYGSPIMLKVISHRQFLARLPSGLYKVIRVPHTPHTTSSKTVFFRKKSISVRGVAKNPVDHPNGGSSKNRCPNLTPWGKIAKLGK